MPGKHTPLHPSSSLPDPNAADSSLLICQDTGVWPTFHQLSLSLYILVQNKVPLGDTGLPGPLLSGRRRIHISESPASLGMKDGGKAEKRQQFFSSAERQEEK